MSSMDAVISNDVVRARAELAALTTGLANARNEIAAVSNTLIVTRSELAAARNEIAAGSASSPIRSVQRGVALITTPTPPASIGGLTVYVAAVNPAKCMLNVTGFSGYTYDPYAPHQAHAQLTSATTIQLTLAVPIRSGYSSYFYMAWELVEFK